MTNTRKKLKQNKKIDASTTFCPRIKTKQNCLQIKNSIYLLVCVLGEDYLPETYLIELNFSIKMFGGIEMKTCKNINTQGAIMRTPNTQRNTKTMKKKC